MRRLFVFLAAVALLAGCAGLDGGSRVLTQVEVKPRYQPGELGLSARPDGEVLARVVGAPAGLDAAPLLARFGQAKPGAPVRFVETLSSDKRVIQSLLVWFDPPLTPTAEACRTVETATGPDRTPARTDVVIALCLGERTLSVARGYVAATDPARAGAMLSDLMAVAAIRMLPLRNPEETEGPCRRIPCD